MPPVIDERAPGTRMLPLDRLQPHPLNANVLPEDLRAKLAAHIRRTGRYPHLVVRPHPTEEGRYQILDGHHRALVLRELGHETARCDVWDVDDREAKLLLATLNRLEGQDVPRRRAELLHELLGEIGRDDLAGLVPESPGEIEELHRLLEFPEDDLVRELAERAEAEDRVLPVTMTFVLSPEAAETVEAAIEAASDGTPGRDRRARGLLHLAKAHLETEADG